MRCLNCGKECEADFVDNGVGNQRIGPWRCESCGWAEYEGGNDYPILGEGQLIEGVLDGGEIKEKYLNFIDCSHAWQLDHIQELDPPDEKHYLEIRVCVHCKGTQTVEVDER